MKNKSWYSVWWTQFKILLWKNWILAVILILFFLLNFNLFAFPKDSKQKIYNHSIYCSRNFHLFVVACSRGCTRRCYLWKSISSGSQSSRNSNLPNSKMCDWPKNVSENSSFHVINFFSLFKVTFATL